MPVDNLFELRFAPVRSCEDTMRGYGRFYPVTQADQMITERWTPLVIRELLSGSHRFNDIQRGVPLMSPALLTYRLKTSSCAASSSGDRLREVLTNTTSPRLARS